MRHCRSSWHARAGTADQERLRRTASCGAARRELHAITLTGANDLYGLPLDRFVAERGALAKTLRGERRTDEAARIAALRKPSVAAWVVNQLVRTQSRAVATLFTAGDELHNAQAELLAGRGDADALREARRRERDAVDDLTQVARGLLSSDGQEPTQATLDRVSETLHAAALDDDARAQARDGCLERELRWVGFGASDAAGTTPEGERAEGERAERERAERRKSARKAETAARRLAERTARDLVVALERRDLAAASLNEAEDALAVARERAEDARLAHEEAQRALEGG